MKDGNQPDHHIDHRSSRERKDRQFSLGLGEEYRKLFLNTYRELGQCWEYLLFTYPDVENAPIFTFRGLKYRPLSILDQSLRLFSTIEPGVLGFRGKILLSSFAGDGLYQFPDTECEWSRFPDDLGLDMFHLTVNHFESESNSRQKSFPQQTLQSLVLGCPLDLFSLRSKHGLLLRNHGWRPSFFHPVYMDSVRIIILMIGTTLLLINLFLYQLTWINVTSNLGHTFFTAIHLGSQGICLLCVLVFTCGGLRGATSGKSRRSYRFEDDAFTTGSSVLGTAIFFWVLEHVCIDGIYTLCRHTW